MRLNALFAHKNQAIVPQVTESELARLRNNEILIEIWGAHAGVGLWDAVLINEDAMHPQSKWSWSAEFRRLLGFSDKKEFPDVVQSWSDRLHPEDAASTFAAFGASLKPTSTGYDVTYRLKMRDGSYRWFRATGGTSRANGEMRVCGSLVDINDQKLAEFAQKRTMEVQAGVVGTMAGALAELAAGDLTSTIETSFDGDMDRLRVAFNQAVSRFSTVVTQLRETSRALKTATGEILSGTNDLSERTTRQAATIQQTSSSMDQLSATVVDNAKRADEARVKAGLVSTTAEISGGVMHQANEAMERITQSSQKISNIIGLIDDIAFQTNLLALNASVEAARAGEAGKGFAVVAVEVRRLAQSAAQASKEVKVLIDQSATEVKGGTDLVADAAEKLSSMLDDIRENGTLMDAMAQASRNQASAIKEVLTAVHQMDEMTQHNAALVEETNAAIEQTETQASELDRIVDVFRVSERHGSSSRAPARSAARTPARSTAATSRAYLSQGNAAIDKDWSEF